LSSFTDTVAGYFSSIGYKPNAIAGILGNSEQESTDNPNAAGGGAWQQISDFGSGTGGSLLNQMKALAAGLAPYKSKLNAAQSPQQAALIVSEDYERPGIPDNANRERYAASAYQQLSGSNSRFRSGGGTTALQRMQAEAQGIVSKGYPYTWGGGHSQLGVPSGDPPGFDCSGFVSAILGAGGYLNSPQTTSGLHGNAGKLSPGKGLVTVWDRYMGVQGQEHVIIDLAGTWYESGGDTNQGPHQMSGAQAAAQLAQGGFSPYHPTGMNRNTIGTDNDTGKYGGTRPGGESSDSGNPLSDIADAIKFVLDPNSILRAVEFVAGLGLMAAGLNVVLGVTSAPAIASRPVHLVRDIAEGTGLGTVVAERSARRGGRRMVREQQRADRINTAHRAGRAQEQKRQQARAGTSRRDRRRARRGPSEDIPF